MAQEYSFDVVAEVDFADFQDAHNIALKQIRNRYDLKGKVCELEFRKAEKELILKGSDDYTIEAMLDIFHTQLSKRGINLKVLEERKQEEAPGGNVRKTFALRDSLKPEECKTITKALKASSLKKVRATIQGECVRLSANSKDSLQDAQKMIQELNLQCPIKFTNYK